MATRQLHLTGLALLSTALLMGAAHPAAAAALSMKECGAKYQAAKSAGTLNGMDWKAFRTTQCGAAPAAAPVTTAAAAPAAPGTPAGVVSPAAAPVATGATAAPAPVAEAKTDKAKVAKSDVPQAASPVFPGAIDPKFASLKAGKAREKTCLEQYHTNKATGGNASLSWIQKGGGYYSACSKHLKSV